MKKLFAIAFLTASGYLCAAQKKVEHYPDGTKKFEGDYFYAWNSIDDRDVVWDRDTSEMLNPSEREMEMLDAYANLLPEKLYEGHCTFYFKNGQKSHEGNYTRGAKNGKFSYWWIDGMLLAERTFVNGMADGEWMVYGKGKQPMVVENYRAFTQAELDSLHRDFADALRDVGRDRDRDWFHMAGRSTIDYDYSDPDMAGVSRFTQQIDAFAKELEQRSIWDGQFVYRNTETQKKAIEMHFKDNVQVGTWRVWDPEGKVDMEGVFKKGKLVKFKDSKPPVLPIPKPATSAKDQDEQVIAEPPPPDVFKYVEQMPEAPYDVNEYIRQNLGTPSDTVIDGGRVHIQFVVEADGTLTDVKAAGSRRLPASYEQAAMDVVKSMPPWKPGRQNGRAVKVYFTLPVIFKAK